MRVSGSHPALCRILVGVKGGERWGRGAMETGAALAVACLDEEEQSLDLVQYSIPICNNTILSPIGSLPLPPLLLPMVLVFKYGVSESFLAGLGSGELGESSPEDQHFVSFEVSEVLPPLLSGEGASDGAVSEFLCDALFGDDCSNLASARSPSDLDHLFGELQSPDGDDLPLDALAIDEHSLIVQDVHDGGQLSLEWAVVDPGHAADFHELVVCLHRGRGTIFAMW